MKNYHNFNIFGHDRPILRFLISMLIVLLAILTSEFIYSRVEKCDMDWTEYVFFVLLVMLTSISYFIGRLIAYKTMMFPNIQNRDGVLKWSFGIIGLSLMTIAIIFY